MPRQSVTYASYPNVRTRAVGSSDGRRAFGHGSDASLAVHVFSRSPVRPWTKTMLGGNYQLGVIEEQRCTYSTTAPAGLQSDLMPEGKVFVEDEAAVGGRSGWLC
jgi:hypothetical protein